MTQQKVIELPEQTGMCQFITDQRQTEMQADIKKMVAKWNTNHCRQERRKDSCTSKLHLLQSTVKKYSVIVRTVLL